MPSSPRCEDTNKTCSSFCKGSYVPSHDMSEAPTSESSVLSVVNNISPNDLLSPSLVDDTTSATDQWRNKHGSRVPSYKDFVIIKPISRGAFGKVYLGCKKNNPDKKYAIKVMKKADMIHKNLVNQVIAERNALALSKSPFIVRLYYSLQSERYIYLVMEYMIGGDVKSLLAIYGFFDEDMAVMYIAEITLALEYLHSHGIVHRDLKPDNLLISAEGHIKLTDFGLSQVNLNRRISIHDVVNSPTVNGHRSPVKDDYLRTPGQILSLTSNFAFAVPHSKSAFAKKCPGNSSFLSPAQHTSLLSETHSCEDHETPPPIKSLTASLKEGLLSKTTASENSVALKESKTKHSPTCPKQSGHESTAELSVFMTNSTPRSCSTVSMGLQKSYAAQNLKSLRESCISDSCGGDDSHETDSSFEPSHSRASDASIKKLFFPPDQRDDDQPQRRKRAFLCVEKSPSNPKVGSQRTDLTNVFSVVSLGDEHRVKRQNSSVDCDSSMAADSSAPSHRLDFSHIDVEDSLKISGKNAMYSSSLSDLDDSDPSSSTNVKLSLDNSCCDEGIIRHIRERKRLTETRSGSRHSSCSQTSETGSWEIREQAKRHGQSSRRHITEVDQRSKGGSLDMSVPSRRSSLDLSYPSSRHSIDLSHNSRLDSKEGYQLFKNSMETNQQSKRGNLEPSQTSLASRKHSCGSSLPSLSTDEQLSTDDTDHEDLGSAAPLELSTMFQDGRRSVANDADVSDMSASDCTSGRSGNEMDASLGGVSRQGTTDMSGLGTDMHSLDNIASEPHSHSGVTPEFRNKMKESGRTLLPFKVMRFSSLPSYISVTDTEGSDEYSTPMRSKDGHGFKTPVMQNRCTPLRTPKSVRRGVQNRNDMDRILGTPDYLAPELLLQLEHGPPVDWWALGVCLYEFLTGVPPFNDTTPEAVFQNILNRDLLWPEGEESLSPEAHHAIERLLDMNPETRATAKELKLMSLVNHLEWDKLLTCTPHFVPNPDNDTDTTYFEARNTLQNLKVSAVDMDI